MLRWLVRHRRAIAATTILGGVAAYGAYYMYRKKCELDELVETLGLQQLLSGGDTRKAKAQSYEERYACHVYGDALTSTHQTKPNHQLSTPGMLCRVRDHFLDTQREADRLLCDALPKLHEQLSKLIDTEELQGRLRAQGALAEPESWHELKVLVVSRLLTAQYALVLTLLAARIRLNIIGKHYLIEAQAAADGARSEAALSKLTKRRFLSMDNWSGLEV